MSLYHSEYAGSRTAAALFDAFVRSYLRLRISGEQHLPEHGPFILAANHASHADTAVVYASLPRRLRRRVVAAAARDYFFENRLRRASARMLYNAVPVDRHVVPGRDPLRHPIRALREGYGLLIYPEGTRSPDGSVSRFRSGIGRLVALFPGVPVIPIWLDTADVMPKGSFAPQPRTVDVRFGAPLLLSAAAEDRASWLAAGEEVRAAVLQLRDAGTTPAPSPPPEEAAPAGDPADSRWPQLGLPLRRPHWLRWPLWGREKEESEAD